MRGRGFSMVETVVSLALIALVVVFLFSIFPAARKGMVQSENRGNAAWLGWSLLDQARAADFDDLAASSGTHTFTGTRDGLSYTQTVSYELQVETVAEGKKRVWVTLTWDEATGSKSMVLETILVEAS